MLEMAIIMPLCLGMVMAALDLGFNLGKHNLAEGAVQYAARTAAYGYPDADVVQDAVDLSMGTLRREDVTVTHCSLRQAVGLPVTVEARWRPGPFVPNLPGMAVAWARIAPDGFVKRVTVAARAPCQWDLL
jgi:hypothetical protein